MTIEELKEARTVFYRAADEFKRTIRVFCAERNISTGHIFGDNGSLDYILRGVRAMINATREPNPPALTMPEPLRKSFIACSCHYFSGIRMPDENCRFEHRACTCPDNGAVAKDCPIHTEVRMS
jgi:hypothetical protein